MTVGKRESIVLGVVLMLVVIAAGWFFLVKPASSKVSELKSQAAAQEQANDATRNQISALRSDKKKLPKDIADYTELAQKVPSTVELPDILRSVQRLAEQAGVKLTGITPSGPVPLTGVQGIDEVDVTLVVQGGYAEVEEFDHSLEGLSRAFLVTSFSLASADVTANGGGATATPEPGDDTTVSATFNGRVLVNTAIKPVTSQSKTN